ncbi:MAG: hypothetical protein WA951_11435, partial [Leeuwenhoekiella sp.]
KFIKFINESLKYCKAIAADNEGRDFLDKSAAKDFMDDKAVFINREPKEFIAAIAKHRNWERSAKVADIAV